MTYVSQLDCSVCDRSYAPNQVWNLCQCGGPLLVRYDLAAIRAAHPRESLESCTADLWRYGPMLPVEPENIICLGEGWTPMVRARSLGEQLGVTDLWIKDEGLNPTGSFKARGLACAIAMCRQLGIGRIAIPSAGNAAGAAAAYAAAAGIEAFIFMPRDVPLSNYIECKASGANVTLVDGLISDCGRMVAEGREKNGWFEVSTLKEPYRIEGKKTMGYEVAEQFDWALPDVILYPAGGGVGLIGMWKAFDEMEALGWIGQKRPKMFAVQSAGCQPVVRAWEQGAETSDFWQSAWTVASGLRVPKPLGDRLMLRAIRESNGGAVAVSDRNLLEGAVAMATAEGIFGAPEGGACVAAIPQLLKGGQIQPNERIVLFNTGSGLKYLEAFSTLHPRTESTQADKLGGLITPR